MKKTAALLLLIAFTLQTFGRALVVVDYYTNTSAFAKNCINKARPKMHCNGKCQMMKKWKEEEKKEQEKSARKLNVQDEVLSSRSFFTQITGISGRTVSRLPQYASPLPDNLPRLVFHPPGC